MKRLFIAILLSASFVASGLVAQAQEWQRENDPPLVPLTAEEQKLDPRKIIAEQPDFVADQEYYYRGPRDAVSFQRKVGKAGTRFGIFSDVQSAITDLGKSKIILDHGQRQFERLTLDDAEERSVEDSDFRELLSRPKAVISIRGRRLVRNRMCIEMEVANVSEEDPSRKLWLWVDTDRKNLIIGFRTSNQANELNCFLSDISFKPSREMFEIPSGYVEVEKFEWKRVKVARVVLDGRSNDGASIFRNSEGTLLARIVRPGSGQDFGHDDEEYFFIFLGGHPVKVEKADFLDLESSSGGAIDNRVDNAFSKWIPEPEGKPVCGEPDCPAPRMGDRDGGKWVEFSAPAFRKNRVAIRVEW